MSAHPFNIAVIIPHLNQPGHLGKCLSSLIKQNYDLDRIEIIVVDNGSETLPTAICVEYPNVTLVSERDPGPGPARNHGIAISSAPLLAFIDADCVADAGWLTAIENAFSSPQTQIIGGDVRISQSRIESMSMLEAYESVYAYRQKEYIEKKGFSGTGNLAMRRTVYASVGAFAGLSIAEDREWGRRATAMGFKISYVPNMIVSHPARQNSEELRTKWARHIAHDYEEQVQSGRDRLIWLVKALALIVSPIWEFVRIISSDRLSGWNNRLSAWRTLIGIRLYRGGKMIAKMLRTNKASGSATWNR